MFPNVHIYEKLMFQQVQERQRKVAQQRLGMCPRHRIIRQAIGKLGLFLMVLGTRMKQHEVAASS